MVSLHLARIPVSLQKRRLLCPIALVLHLGLHPDGNRHMPLPQPQQQQQQWAQRPPDSCLVPLAAGTTPTSAHLSCSVTPAQRPRGDSQETLFPLAWPFPGAAILCHCRAAKEGNGAEGEGGENTQQPPPLSMWKVGLRCPPQRDGCGWGFQSSPSNRRKQFLLLLSKRPSSGNTMLW